MPLLHVNKTQSPQGLQELFCVFSSSHLDELLQKSGLILCLISSMLRSPCSPFSIHNSRLPEYLTHSSILTQSFSFQRKPNFSRLLLFPCGQPVATTLNTGDQVIEILGGAGGGGKRSNQECENKSFHFSFAKVGRKPREGSQM